MKAKGLTLVLTGDGKGKSSSAFGMVLRAAGWGMAVLVVQFIKGKTSGEERGARLLPTVTWLRKGRGFTWRSKDPAQDLQAARNAWEAARAGAASGDYDLVVFDELFYAMGLGWVTEEEVLALIGEGRAGKTHLVLTGRGAPAGIIAAADTVTDMAPVKHAFQAGIKGKKGIEF